MDNPTASMLIIGDEILSGRTRDVNLNVLAVLLDAAGIDLCEARVVADRLADIVPAVRELRARYDHLFTSGGIGPTHDDVTAEAVAEALGVRLSIREDAVEALAANYPGGRADLNAARLRMARVPEGARLIRNPVSGAPGFSAGNVHVLAGVPMVFSAMLEGLLPGLPGGTAATSVSVRIHRPEGDIAGPLGDIAAEHSGVLIGSYPFFSDGRPGSNIVIRGKDRDLVDRAFRRVRKLAAQFGQ